MSNAKPKVVTTPAEWIGVVVIIILSVAVVLYILLYLRPQLFAGTTGFGPSSNLPTTETCSTSAPPGNLSATVGDFAKPSFDATWDAVFVTSTPSASILGYYIYVSPNPGITISNTARTSFTVVPQVRVVSSSGGGLSFGRTYYFKVATVDTCGTGILSNEEGQITI